MDALTALFTRKSAAALTEPAPDEGELREMFRAAVRAPDHGAIRPWRFIVFRGESRADLGAILKDCARKSDPAATEAALEKAALKPFRAPLVIAVIATVCDHPKVPAIEQVISAGAAAQNIMLAAHAMGFAGIWRTGAPCYDESVRGALGVAGEDQIVGFLYLGSARTVPPLPDCDPDAFVEYWETAGRS
ncbi:NAD(P)H nitroreductase [Sneathiella chinensis]|uniref:Putative NAD(P)H nitroreductase n=1 Tax=Sneathiella chinensis TaxID=349750 RepID=A0ABQ5U1Z3_9PROT|nr:NAD(P)H nitroreductase [Sneathiella chinensis]GLQ06197.1 nitroreductase [Sneathiella chinensis]